MTRIYNNTGAFSRIYNIAQLFWYLWLLFPLAIGATTLTRNVPLKKQSKQALSSSTELPWHAAKFVLRARSQDNVLSQHESATSIEQPVTSEEIRCGTKFMKVCCTEETQNSHKKICKHCRSDLFLADGALNINFVADVNDPQDETCSDSKSIACCLNQGDDIPALEGFYQWSKCRNGEGLRRKRRKSNESSVAKYQEKKAATTTESGQNVEGTEQSDPYPITSDELQCPKVEKGKAKPRPLKLCCQRPWTPTYAPRKCKKCSYSAQTPLKSC